MTWRTNEQSGRTFSPLGAGLIERTGDHALADAAPAQGMRCLGMRHQHLAAVHAIAEEGGLAVDIELEAGEGFVFAESGHAPDIGRLASA